MKTNCSLAAIVLSLVIALAFAFLRSDLLWAQNTNVILAEDQLLNADIDQFPDKELIGWKVATPTPYPGKVERAIQPTMTAYSGKFCLMITPGPQKGISGVLRTLVANQKKIPAKNGDKFRVRVWAKGNGGTIGICLQQYSNAGAWGSGIWPVFQKKLTGDWREFSGAGTVKGVNKETGLPLEVGYILFHVDIAGNEGAEEVVAYVDDAAIETVPQ